MKRAALLMLFSLLLACTAGAEIINENYYIENRKNIQDGGKSAERIMPNTLRLVLYPGENGKVSADIFPDESKNTEIFWSLEEDNGTAEVTLSGREFIVYGQNEGEDVLNMRTSGGAEASVAIAVEEAPRTFLHAEEYTEEERKEETTELYDRAVLFIRAMICVAAVLLLASVMAFVSKRRKRD